MNIALWVVAGLLAALYLVVGAVKILKGKALAERMPWARDFPDVVIRFIGVCEVLGALGLVLPEASGRLDVLTPAAAAGLALLQVLAVWVHVRRGETQQLAVNVVLLILALVVAVGRFAQWTTEQASTALPNI